MRSGIANGLFVEVIGSRHQENQGEQKPPKTTTAPCQKLIAPTSLEIAIESVAIYFLLLLDPAYEPPRKLSLSAAAKIDFLALFNQRAAEWAFCGAGKFT